MDKLWTLAMKDLRLLLRDRAGLFFTVAFPLLYALFFGAVFSPGGEDEARRIPVRLVDLDGSPASRAFLDSLGARKGLECRVDSLAGAEAAVRRGRASAAIILPKGFGEATRKLLSGEAPQVELLADPARQAEGALLQGMLMELAFRRLQETFQRPALMLPQVRVWRDSLALAPGKDPTLQPLRRWTGELDLFLGHLARQDSLSAKAQTGNRLARPDFTPLRVVTRALRQVREGPQSAFEVSFPQGLVWGLISVAASFGLSLVVERKEGTLRRLRASPLRRRHILGGKALACALAVVAICLAMLLCGRPLGVQAERPLLLLALIPSAAAAFTGLMLLVSVLGRTERAAAGMGWSLMMVLAMAGGGMVPLMFMPDWMRTLSHASPVKWTILGFEGVLWRGFGWTELLPVCVVLLSFGALCALVGLKAFRWRDA